jgi:hypothetical protein
LPTPKPEAENSELKSQIGDLIFLRDLLRGLWLAFSSPAQTQRDPREIFSDYFLAIPHQLG